MLQHSGLKKEIWAKAVQTIVSLINLSPSKAIKLQVPHAMWLGKQPNYNRLHFQVQSIHPHTEGEPNESFSAFEKVHFS